MNIREAIEITTAFLAEWGETWAIQGITELSPGHDDEYFVTIYHKRTKLQSTLSPVFQPSLGMLQTGYGRDLTGTYIDQGGYAQCGAVPIVGEPGPEIFVTLCATCRQPMEPDAAGHLCCHTCGYDYPQYNTVPTIASTTPLTINLYLDGRKIAEVIRKQS